MKRRGPEVDPELEHFLSFRKAARRLPEDVRARVLARSRAYLSREEAGPARILFEARLPPPSVLRHRAARRLALVATIAIAAVAAGAIAALRRRAPDVPIADSPPTSVAPPSAVRGEAIPHRGPAVPPTSRNRPRMTRPHRILENPLADEVELLQRAQQAYASGDFSDTLVLVAQHAHRFPRGPLAEECEALRVKSLLSSGRGDDARRAGAAFSARFPRSVLLPRIEEALGRPEEEGRPMRQ